jgi:hypothetical protein
MNFHINKILEEKTITSYLEEKGVLPQKKTGDKYVYRCPVHQGDNDPSFIVYPVGTKSRNYQTYYCFGCHSGITLINLKSDLEGISTKESVRHFLKDVKIDSQDVMQSIIDDLKKNESGIEDNKSVEFLLLLINTTCRRHIVEQCQKDEEEITFFEKFFQRVNDIARARDVDLLEKVVDLLPRGNEKRTQSYNKRNEMQEVSSLTWKI